MKYYLFKLFKYFLKLKKSENIIIVVEEAEDVAKINLKNKQLKL